MTPAPILAWHFVGDTLRDDRPIPPDGVELRHDGPVVPCRSGLHASIRLIDALRYAPGATLCHVACAGTIVHGDDKLACSSRTILWRLDATDVLARFARSCALDVIHLWDAPGVVVGYLLTGDEAMRAAAWGVAWAASRDAKGVSERAAAWAAAQAAEADVEVAAAWVAARTAAGVGAGGAVKRAAARNVAGGAQNDRLTRMVMQAVGLVHEISTPDAARARSRR